MLKKNIFKLVYGVTVVMFLLQACESDDNNDSPVESDNQKILNVKKVAESGGGTVYDYLYFSLKDGIVLDSATNSSSQNWDLRFTASTKILTNSGETAVEEVSGGLGGAMYTGSTDFSSAINVSDLSLVPDNTVYTVGHGGASSKSLTNVISFTGYATGDGSITNPYDDADFSADGYFSYSGMPPVYVMTDKVYVVKFGDGTGYAKLQILSVEYFSEEDTPNIGDKTTTYSFLVKFETL